MTAIEKLLDLYGNVRDAADALGVDMQLVHIWRKQGYIPFKRGEFIEKKTGGKIKAAKVWKDASLARH